MSYSPVVHVDAELTDKPIIGWPCHWCKECIVCAEAYGWQCVEGHDHEAEPPEGVA